MIPRNSVFLVSQELNCPASETPHTHFCMQIKCLAAYVTNRQLKVGLSVRRCMFEVWLPAPIPVRLAVLEITLYLLRRTVAYKELVATWCVGNNALTN